MKTYRVWYCESSIIETGEYDLPLKAQEFVRCGEFTGESTKEILDIIPAEYYIIDCELLETITV